MNNHTEPPEELREAFVSTFAKYFLEANRTHNLMLDVSIFPVSLQERLAILDQRQLESVALEKYLSARTKLLAAASQVGLLADS